MKKKTLKLVLFLAIVSGISGGLLSVVYEMTYPIIKERAIRLEQENLYKIFPDGVFNEIDGDNNVLVTNIYEVENQGFIYKISSRGYNDNIIFLLGIDNDSNVVGYEMLELSDTPDIGDLVFKEPFVNVIKESNTSSSIDIIAGSTYSSGAVINGIYEAFDIYNNSKGIIVDKDDRDIEDKDKDKPIVSLYDSDDSSHIYNILSKGMLGDNLLEIIIDKESNTISDISFLDFVDSEDYELLVNNQDNLNRYIGVDINSINDIDVVSGASFSSKSISNGIIRAFEDLDSRPIVIDNKDNTFTYIIKSKGLIGINTFEIIINSVDYSIVSVKFLDAKDTSEYVELVDNRDYLDGFNGLSLDDIDSVDVVSGASFTSQSLLDAIGVVIESIGVINE